MEGKVDTYCSRCKLMQCELFALPHRIESGSWPNDGQMSPSRTSKPIGFWRMPCAQSYGMERFVDL